MFSGGGFQRGYLLMICLRPLMGVVRWITYWAVFHGHVAVG